MTSLYDQNLEFNEILEETYGPVLLGSSKFSPAKILFKLDEIAYLQELADWKEEKKENLLELAHEALNYRSNKSRFNNLIEEEQELKNITKTLLHFRKSSLPLMYGDLQIIEANEKVFIFSRSYFIPASLATARVWSTVFVEPPIAISRTKAFFIDFSVIMSSGFMFFSIRVIIWEPAFS